MIKRLVIHRFRGIREGVLDDLGKVNLLIGPNNSGKTAILEMLYLGGTSGRSAQLILDDVPTEGGENIAFQATTSLRSDLLGLEPLPRLRRRHGHHEKWRDAPMVLTEEGGLEVHLGTDHKVPLRSFRLGAPLDAWGLPDRTRFYKKDLGVVSLFSLNGQTGIPHSLTPALFDKQGIKSEVSRWHYLWDPVWVYRWNRQEPIDHLTVWAEEGQYPASNKILFFDFHIANEHFTSRFARWAKNLPWDWAERIGEHLGHVFPELEGAKVEVDDAPDGQKGEAGYIRKDGGGRIVIDQFGDGARHAFKVLAGLVALCETVDEEHPGLFLWEDPELFMHPESLDALLGEILLLTKDKPVQIFLSSQSMEVIALLTSHIQRNMPVMQPDYRVFRLDLEDGRLYAAKYHYRNILAWLEEGMDARFWGATKLPISYRYSSQSESATEDA